MRFGKLYRPPRRVRRNDAAAFLPDPVGGRATLPEGCDRPPHPPRSPRRPLGRGRGGAGGSELAGLIERFTGRDGEHATAVPGLRLFRSSVPTGPVLGVLGPALCLVAQGDKRIAQGGETFGYDPRQFLLVAVDLPLTGEVVAATPREPYLGLQLDLDPAQIAGLVAEADLPPADGADGVDAAAWRGVMVGRLDAALLEAVARLLRLLGRPRDLRVLGPMAAREVLYLLLVGEQGARLRRIALGGRGGEGSPGLADAFRRLRRDFAEPLRVEELARAAHLSPSAFHRHFKAVAAMTPIQYQKHLRLQAARRLMLTGAADAATAAYRVGYASASQFSREYRRLFGQTPRRDVARLAGD